MVHGKNGEIRMSPSYLRRKGGFFAPDESVVRDGNRPIIGEVVGYKAGYGFVVLKNQKRLYLSPPDMSRVLHGDMVKVITAYDAVRDREYAKLIEILVRKQKTILGIYHQDDAGFCVVPLNTRLPRSIYLNQPVEGAQIGSILEVKVISRRNHELPRVLRGEFVRLLPHKEDARLETDIAISDYALPHVFSPEAYEEAQRLPNEVEPKEFPERPYLGDLPFVTIDGEDAQDFDDAVYCKADNEYYHIWIAIADVSHYVKPGTSLDTTAAQRSCSAYFPDRVVPMLPEKLSNELCSLKPNCNRLVMVCQMLIDKMGKRDTVKFYPAIIRSHARLTYEEVYRTLSEKEMQGDEMSPEIKASLRALKDLTKIFLAVRSKREALDFSCIQEIKPILNDKGDVEDLYIYKRNFAHQMIEEAMLAANSTAAWFLSKKGIPFLYRVHREPEPSSVEKLKDFLEPYGINILPGPRGRIDTSVYSYLIKTVNQFPEATTLEMQILRSLQRAEYSRRNYGHFGLNYKSYTHFTSPIRRYPDLVVHRALKKIVIRDEESRAEYPYHSATISQLAGLCSRQGRMVEQAGFQVLDGLKCRYLKRHKKSKYTGLITSVVEFAFYVQLKDVPIEGRVHLKNLHGDFYRYNATTQRFIGSRTGHEYKVGDEITVKLGRISLEERRIDLIPI